MSLACVNVDLDSLGHYCRIHGLPESVLPAGRPWMVYRQALDRFAELFAEVGVPATFFAVGRDLEDLKSAEAVRRAHDAGHEIGNHTYGHDYALTRRAPGEIAVDVERGAEAIAQVIGRRPVGFRAPGYTITAPLLEVLAGQHYAYDSSVFPAAPYWAAKAAVMAGLALLGRESRAILDRPRVLLAPRLPYRPDPEEPYRASSRALPLLELPITVHPLARVPLIGMTVTSLPPRAFDLVWRGMAKLPFVNLELHGIDLLDESDVASPELARAQRDLAVPVSTKRARIKAVLQRFAQGFETVTLAAAAERQRS